MKNPLMRWLYLLVVGLLCSPAQVYTQASVPFVSTSVEYDGWNCARVVYDGALYSNPDYDEASVFPIGEGEMASSVTRSSFCEFVEFLAAEGATPALGSLTPSQANTIQAFVDRFGAEVNVVGSRAAGTAGAMSDFDYVIGGNASLRNSASYYLPRGINGGEINASGVETGIDIFNANRTPLDPTRPFIQFTPGNAPVVGPR